MQKRSKNKDEILNSNF